jgi:hypothetical protein
MTSDAHGGTRILGSLRSANSRGVVRMEDRFDTDIDDVWSALTDPRRLARWYGEVEGDLRLLPIMPPESHEGKSNISACQTQECQR